MNLNLSEHYEHRVQLPNLAVSNRYTNSGLSFQFVSHEAFALNSYVTIGDMAFSICNVSMAFEDCEYGDGLLYTCTESGRSVKDDFDVREINGMAVTPVTDSDQIANIRKVANYC